MANTEILERSKMLTTIALLNALTSYAKNIKAAASLYDAYAKIEEEIKASTDSVSRIFVTALEGENELSLMYRQSFEISQYIRNEDDLKYLGFLAKRDSAPTEISNMKLAVSIDNSGLGFELSANGRSVFSILTANAVVTLILPEILPEIIVGLQAQVNQVNLGLNLLQNVYREEE